MTEHDAIFNPPNRIFCSKRWVYVRQESHLCRRLSGCEIGVEAACSGVWDDDVGAGAASSWCSDSSPTSDGGVASLESSVCSGGGVGVVEEAAGAACSGVSGGDEGAGAASSSLSDSSSISDRTERCPIATITFRASARSSTLGYRLSTGLTLLTAGHPAG